MKFEASGAPPPLPVQGVPANPGARTALLTEAVFCGSLQTAERTLKTFSRIQTVTLWFIKGLSGGILAYVLALIGREFLQYGLFAFLFIVISVTSAFLYLVKELKFPGLFLVDGFLVALALFLKFYVHLSSG